jgi:hypothetical protein
MEQFAKDIGRTISNMGGGRKQNPMDVFMRGSLLMEKNMVKVNIHGPMACIMMVNGKTML